MQPGICEHEARLLAYGVAPGKCTISGGLHGAGLIVLFSNRSGSNYLVSLLGQLPGLSLEYECFNWDVVLDGLRATGFDSISQYLHHLRSQVTTPWWGMKVGETQLAMVVRFGLLSAFQKGCRIIWVRRRDLVAQAVSYYIASRSGQWVYGQRPIRAVPEFDYEAIAAVFSSLAEASAQAASLLSLLQPRYTCVWYEDVCHSPGTEVERIADFLEVKPTVRIRSTTSEFRKQIDPRKAEYAARFREDARTRFHLNANAYSSPAFLGNLARASESLAGE